MNGCTREECFSRMFLCRVETCERRRWILYLKEITIYVSFLCVCVLDKSIPVHCVFARVWVVCVFSSIQVISLESITVICVSLLGCVMFLCLAAGSTPMEQGGWLACCSWLGFHHSEWERSASTRQDTFVHYIIISLIVQKSLDSAQGLQHEPPRSFDRYSDLQHAHTVLSSSLAIGIFTYTMLLKGRLQDRHISSASVLLHKHKSMPILNHLEPGSVKSWHQVTRTSVELLAWDDDRRRFSPAFERRREGSLRGQTESWAVKHS